LIGGEDVFAAELDGAGGGFDQSEYRLPERRLSTTGFTDEPDRFAASDIEVYAIDGFYAVHLPFQ
jgi:hypothetical protein